MTLVRRIAMGAATAGVGLALAAGPAAAAHAGTAGSPGGGTVERIESTAWVTLDQSDRGYRVEAVRCFLDQLGYIDGCAPSGKHRENYTRSLAKAVKKYQAARQIGKTGVVGPTTWEKLRQDVGLVEAGDHRKDTVRALEMTLDALGPQYSSIVPNDQALDDKGTFDSKTVARTKNYQSTQSIHRTGKIGPTTFRALYAQRNVGRG